MIFSANEASLCAHGIAQVDKKMIAHDGIKSYDIEATSVREIHAEATAERKSVVSKLKIRGGCLCEAVAYEVEDRFAYVAYCHCKSCQRQSGSAFCHLGAVRAADLTVTRGSDLIAEYVKSAQTTLSFCSVCGSQLFTRKPSRGVLHVRIGTMDRPPTMKPIAHICVDEKMTHHVIGDGLLQIAGLPLQIPEFSCKTNLQDLETIKLV